MTETWAIQLPHADKIVLLALADNSNDEGSCFPSITTLTRKCGMDRSTVLRIISRLELGQHLSRETRSGRSTIYHVHPSQSATGRIKRPVADGDVPRRAKRPPPVAQSDPTRRAAPPITVIEPSIEPSREPSTRAREAATPLEEVFEHWKQAHRHPHAKLDDKRRKLLTNALHAYDVATLCQAISGYLNSPHHMGQNDRATVYDDIEIFLRDSKHIDAGLKFYAEPPRGDLSPKTRTIMAATETWVPPESRNARS